MLRFPPLVAAALCLGAAGTASADISDEASACIDMLRDRYGNVGGEVLEQSGSEAGTLVRLRDANGTEYECIVWSGPEVADFRVVGEGDSADDGGGAMAGAPRNDEIVVRFAPGTSGATYSDSLGSGGAVRYMLGAQNEQFLTVELRGNSEFINYIIYVPDGDILFESSQGGYEYYGQLYEGGDHVVEVFYNGDPGTAGSFDIIFQIN